MSGVTTKNFSPLDQPEHPPLATPIFNRGRQRKILANLQSGHISAPVQKLRKLKALYFLQFLKFEKTKCPYSRYPILIALLVQKNLVFA